MLQLAIEDIPEFTFDTIEIDMDHESYTYRTLTQLKKKTNPNRTLCFYFRYGQLQYL